MRGHELSGLSISRMFLRGTSAVIALAGVALCLWLSACSSNSQKSETTGRSSARLSIGPRTLGGFGQAEEETDFGITGKRLFGYVYRRAFPEQQVSQSRHATAIAQLHSMRSALGKTHFDPDGTSPVDACGGTCDEGQACLFGACRLPCSGGEFPCAASCEFWSSLGCYCVPCDAPGDAGDAGGGGPGAPGCGWVPAGPTDVPGRVTALAFDPGDSNRLFSGSVGGLWRSPDQGRRWQRVRIGATSRDVAEIAFNATTREIFVGMADYPYKIRGDGVWMSATGDSDSFTKISNATIDAARVNRVIARPGANGDVYVATSAGLFVGTRSGGTFNWARLDGMDGDVDDMEITFTTTPPTIYAGKVSGTASFALGIWRHDSTGWAKRDGGITWDATAIRIGLTMVTSSPNTLYTKVAAPDGDHFVVYKTTDGGSNWQLLPNADGTMRSLEDGSYGIPWYNTVIAADPNNANIVYLGGVNLYATRDGGSTWSRVNGGTDPNYPLWLHADQHSLAFDPNDSRIVYSGNDGGIYRSTDTSVATWHWTPRAHGMANTEFYRLTSQLANAGLIAGGSQDNGTEITFGNRTWYTPGGCDGTDAAVDAANSSTVYSQCNGNPAEIINAVPYTPGGGRVICSKLANGTCNPGCFSCWNFPTDASAKVTAIGVPVVIAADPTIAATALMRGASTTTPDQELVLKTTDGVNWSTILTPSGRRVSAMTIAATATNPKYYYVAATDASSVAAVYVSPDSGVNWTQTSLGGSIGWVNSIAIDPVTPTRAWVASGGPGQVAQTTNAGGSWTALTPVDAAHSMPPAAAVTGIVVDVTGNRLFAGTDVGVFVGNLSGANSVSWEPYDDGLPDGIDVNDIFLNPQTSTLFVGTWGLGAYTRDITGSDCSSVQLLVRDSVFDQGQTPTPSGMPDPEHPIEDPARPPFYKPDDTDGGRVYFWESTDIRVDVPSLYNASYQFSSVDHVEFESCPASIASCPPWVLTNVDPRRGQLANVYVQVHNRGLAPASNVRVVAMYADASAGVPPLPANFWTQTAVPGTTSCGALDESSGWHMVGCGVVSEVSARIPEVQKFAWNVPASAAEHTCMLTIVDSAQDPITNTTTDVEDLTINDRRVAHRNLHVIDGPSAVPGSGGPAAGGSSAPGTPFSGLSTVFVPNRWNSAGTQQVLLSRSGMESSGRLAFLLPTGVAASTPGLPPKCGVNSSTPGAVTISLPRGLVAESFAVAASGTLQLADRSSVVDAQGANAAVGNAGTGEVHLGVQGQVGSIWARGNVFLAERSIVRGNVTLEGVLQRQNNVTITGTVQQTTALSPADALSWVVQYPATSRGDRTVNSGQSLSEAPGRLGTIQVNSGGKLRLASGTYYLEALRLEWQSVLELDQRSGPTVIYTRQGFTFRASERMVAGSGQPDVLVIAMGDNDVFVETPFIGSVMAPAARQTLGGGRGRFIGMFFGREVWMRPDIVVEQRLSRAFAALPACRALSAAERTKATAAGLAPDLYPVAGVELRQNWPIPFGQRWNIGLRYDSGIGRTGTAGRFRVLSLFQNQVKGGNTFLLRQ